MRGLAIQRGGVLLSTEYKSCEIPMLWRCNCGEEFYMRGYNVLKGGWCFICNKTRYNINYCRKVAEEKGGKCLSDVYKNSDAIMSWECKCGHRWDTNFGCITSGSWCSVCGNTKKIKYTIEDARRLAEEKGGECLSDVLRTVACIITWRCKYSHVWESPFRKNLEGYWCPKCSNIERSLTLDDCHYYAKSFGGECLSTEYKNVSTKLSWKCKYGHIFEKPLGKIKQYGSWCQQCSYAELKYNLEDCYNLATAFNGECLSTEYKNKRTKLTWKCKEGHIFEHTLQCIKGGCWCPYCKGSNGEIVFRDIMEEITGHKFLKVRPNWLRGVRNRPLEIDGYCEELKLAFEYQGQQHFKYNSHFYKNIEDFNRRLANDQIKSKILQERGIRLLLPDYRLPISSFRDFVVKAIC